MESFDHNQKFFLQIYGILINLYTISKRFKLRLRFRHFSFLSGVRHFLK